VSSRPAVTESSESEQLFRLLVGGVHDHGIMVLDVDGRVTTWNVGAERITGYTAEEIIGSHFSIFYPDSPGRAAACERELAIATTAGRFEEEGWRTRKDGSRLWAHVVVTAMRNDRGQLLGFSKLTRDLSERKRAEDAQAARLAAEERFRLLVESVTDYAIFMLDSTGHIKSWNIGAERIKGYSAREIIGRHFSTFYPAEDVRSGKCERELEIATAEGRFEEEGWRVRKDGSRLWANVVISAMRNASGELVGFSKVTRDLTDRRRADEERAARRAAEQANIAKDEFLAMLGHELRNPLAPIVTALELMRMRVDGRSADDPGVHVIERQVKHMSRLVDDLLDVSRITRGKVELRIEHVEVGELVARALEVASPLLEQRRHHVELVPAPEPVYIAADAARMTQVLANLLTNAAKYTEHGGHVRVMIRPGPHDVEVEVKDDGIGIVPELLPTVFDLFVQGYQSAERAVGGLGLGLTLVRSLVNLHGGQVEAHSGGRGQGSTFVVRLPLALRPIHAAVPAAAPVKRSALQARRVLLVDDNEDARFLLCEVLTEIGHEVRTAGDAAAALEIVKDFHPDVAILDIGLPVMDGYALAVRLRAEHNDRPLRIIAVTGYGRANDRERSRQAGFDSHLVKPVDLNELIAEIAGNPLAGGDAAERS
jgi:PAS domain S-box-containing protein